MSDQPLDDDAVLTRNAGTLIFNIMGIGTFLVVFMGFGLFFLWVGTSFCDPAPAIISRAVYSLIYLIVILVLWYAPKEDSYVSSEFDDAVYDHSIIPRVAISLIIGIFSIVAGVLLAAHHLEQVELSTVDHEYNALWLEETTD